MKRLVVFAVLATLLFTSGFTPHSARACEGEEVFLFANGELPGGG